VGVPKYGWECLQVQIFFLYFVVRKRRLVVASPFFLFFRSESKSRMGERRRRFRVTVLGSMWDGGKGWEKAVHMPSCVAYVTKNFEAFYVRQTDSDILGSEYHLVGVRTR